MLDEHTVVENRQPDWRKQFALRIEPRRSIDDVVNLPLTGRKAGVYQRRVLAINGAGRTVGIGFVLERIEHLQFVAVQAEEHAAIAAALALAVGRRRGRPLHVQLAIAKILQRANVAAPLDAFHVAIAGNPFSGAAIHTHPLGEVFSVE